MCEIGSHHVAWAGPGFLCLSLLPPQYPRKLGLQACTTTPSQYTMHLPFSSYFPSFSTQLQIHGGYLRLFRSRLPDDSASKRERWQKKFAGVLVLAILLSLSHLQCTDLSCHCFL